MASVGVDKTVETLKDVNQNVHEKIYTPNLMKQGQHVDHLDMVLPCRSPFEPKYVYAAGNDDQAYKPFFTHQHGASFAHLGRNKHFPNNLPELKHHDPFNQSQTISFR